MGSKNLAEIDLTLVIFTCQGREHLLEKTYKSFLEKCDLKFSKTILAVDGPVDAAILTHINADLVIYNYKRVGYVTSIINALANINTNYFFWLEDDWTFHDHIDLAAFKFQLELHADWTQVIYSKYNPPIDELKSEPIGVDLYKHPYGFSGNPGVCRTSILKDAFDRLALFSKENKVAELSFENFISEYLKENRMMTAIYVPAHRVISHEGFMESTARQYHMINSVNKIESLAYISGLGSDRTVTFKNKLGMFVKFWLISYLISFKIWFSREAYDLAFRLNATYLKKFKQ